MKFQELTKTAKKFRELFIQILYQIQITHLCSPIDVFARTRNQ